MKKAVILGLVVLLLLTLFSSACLQPVSPTVPSVTEPISPVEPVAVKELTILNNSVDTFFPTHIIFRLTVASTVNITDIRLHYAIVRESFARVISEVNVQFVPGTTANAQWVWDMRKTGGLPTGAIIEAWWTVTDAGGNKAETKLTEINFDDSRYAWKSLTENMTNIYWYQGDLSFARELMSTAQQALSRLSQTTGAHLKTPVEIYIYANTQDLQGAMIFPQEWTGGTAFTEFGIITIGINPGSLDWGKGALTHELTHLVVHQMTYNPYIELPTWLEEGLAMYNEGTLDASFTNSLQMALDNNGLISVRSLASPFSANTYEALLSYAQSYSLVEFLVETYGQSKMLDLLTTFSLGSSYDGALKKVYGFDMDGLNSLWREDVIRKHLAIKGKTALLQPASIWSLIETTGFVTFKLQPVLQSGAGRLI